jgi:hypothetical protein
MPIGKMWRFYEEAKKLAGADTAALNMRAVAHYCVVDAERCQSLLVRRAVLGDYREVSTLAYVSLADAHYYAGGMKVCNLLGAYAWRRNILMSMRPSERESEGKYPGAYVLPPEKGIVPDPSRVAAFDRVAASGDAVAASAAAPRGVPANCAMYGCNANTIAAVRISQGTQASNHCDGSTSTSTDPSNAPSRLGTWSHAAHGGCPSRSPRYTHAAAIVPGHRPIVLVALATTIRAGSAGRIAASTGNVRMVPPPATAFTAPSTNDTAASATSPGSGPRARRSFMESRLILFVNAAFTWDEAAPD